MKKRFFLLMFLVSMLLVVSCGKKNVTNNKEGKGLFVVAKLVKGEVVYKLPQGKDWKKLQMGDKLTEATEIEVKEGGFLVLQYPSKYEISLASETKMKIKELQPAKKKGFLSTIFSVLKGMVYSSVTINTKEGDKYEVETPQTVCGVYGTVFCVQNDNDKTIIYTEEGTVYARLPYGQAKKEERVRAGMMLTVDNNGFMGNPKPFNTVKPPYEKIFHNYKVEDTIDHGDIKVNNER